MDDWEKFNRIPLPEEKKDFYGHLNMKDITYEDYTQKDFKTQNSDIMI